MILDDLDMSCRSWLCLKRAGINTTEELCNLTEEEFIKIRNLGRKSTAEILLLMKENNLKFKESELWITNLLF